MDPQASKQHAHDADIPLNRDVFLRQLLRELTGILEEVVGLDEASGFISLVGQNIGEWLNRDYRASLGARDLSIVQVAEVLADLKRRIEGQFEVVSVDAEKIVLKNSQCPFGDRVRDRTSLCMMTSNVFGVIAAENQGYAKVTLRETIARGDPGCFVVVHLTPESAAEDVDGNEYFRS